VRGAADAGPGRRSRKGDRQKLLPPLFHSLNQPLTSVHIALELCLRQPLETEVCRQYLTKALEQTERVASLVASIQDALESESR